MAKINSINNKTQDLTVDPGASGDSFVQFDINGTGEFRIGVDDTDDSFRIAQGSALGTTDTVVVTAAGEVTKPLTPAFLAVLNSDISNVTGDGTNYTVVWDTEVFDQNSDFSSTTFTAPVTGRYQFDLGICIGGITTHNRLDGGFVTSNRTYTFFAGNPSAMQDSSNNLGLSWSLITDMDAADTAYVRFAVLGSTKIIDIVTNGSTDTYSWFSGSLQC